MLTYLEEGLNSLNPGHDLHVINNSFVNERLAGANFIRPYAGSDAAQVMNNIFDGPGIVCTQPAAVLTTNFIGDPLFVDVENFDYHLTAASPAIDAGTDPGALTPLFEYVHPACGEARNIVGAAIDIGAYEFGGAGTPLV